MSEHTYPDDLRYTADHEWVRVDGDVATVGITDYAQAALGDVVFVELPSVGQDTNAGESCGEVESTKSVSDLIAPVGGKVTEVNAALDATPDLVNTAAYGDGWLYKVSLSDASAADSLMTADAYRAQLD